METLRFKQTCMQGLKRVFNIDLEWCQHCGKESEVKVIASIEDPRIIEKILLHLKKKGEYSSQPPIALFTEVLGPSDLFSATEGFE